jgi:hypothetical protein
MKAHEELYDLYTKVKKEGNCTEYVDEMVSQLKLFGTETNGLTRQMVYDKVEELLNQIKQSL